MTPISDIAEQLPVAANISILFPNLSVVERLAAAVEHGFQGFETWWPFSGADPDVTEVEEFVRAVRTSGLQLVGINTYEGDRAAGDRGITADPGARGAFLRTVRTAIHVAAELGCRRVTALYGRRIPDRPEVAQHRCASENLEFAFGVAEAENIKLCLEAVNTTDVPGYLLGSVASVVGVIQKQAQSGVHLGSTFDVYHSVMAGEDPMATIDRWHTYFDHVQVADAPGRGRPGTGVVDFGGVFDHLRSVGYSGWIGLEYNASDDGLDLEWVRAYEKAGVLTRNVERTHRTSEPIEFERRGST